MTTADVFVDVFADAGVALYQQDRLADGLELLAARLDYAGAGELVAALLGVDWVEERYSKGNPQPQPKPPAPPPPKPQPNPPKNRTDPPRSVP